MASKSYRPKQAAAYLGIGVATFWRWASERADFPKLIRLSARCTVVGRAVVLFMRSGRFACRTCQLISYVSQSGSETSRGYAKYHRLHALIEAGKPKWQRWKTFNRLEDRFEVADERTNQSLLQAIQRLQASRY